VTAWMYSLQSEVAEWVMLMSRSIVSRASDCLCIVGLIMIVCILIIILIDVGFLKKY
jgi:hypothetical protein